MFTDYGEEYPITGKHLRQIQNRVHDGIVILNRQYKDLQTFRNGAMLRDACVVLTTAAFEENDYEIRLSSDQFHAELVAADMQQIFQGFLVAFLTWFQEEYVYLQEKAVRKALDVIDKKAEALYCKLLNSNKNTIQAIPNKLKKLSTFPAGTWVELNSVIMGCRRIAGLSILTSLWENTRTTHLPEWSRSIGIITSGTAVKWTMARKVERVLGITIMDRLCMRESSKKESRAEKALTMMKMAI